MGVALAMAALGIGVLSQPTVAPPTPRINRRRAIPTTYGGGRSKTTFHPQHGQRERERRMRQIERGQLRVENGLDDLHA